MTFRIRVLYAVSFGASAITVASTFPTESPRRRTWRRCARTHPCGDRERLAIFGRGARHPRRPDDLLPQGAAQIRIEQAKHQPEIGLRPRRVQRVDQRVG